MANRKEINAAIKRANDPDLIRQVVTGLCLEMGVIPYSANATKIEVALSFLAKDLKLVTDEVRRLRRELRSANKSVERGYKSLHRGITIERLRREIQILRRYGNKDCTALADEIINT